MNTGGSYGGGGGGGDNNRSQQINDTLQYVTIKQILEAATEHDDEKFNINGVQTQQITLVARIIRADVQMTMIALAFDDCTGRIDGSHMLPIEDEMGASEYAVQKRERIKPGVWVRVIAQPQMLNSERRLVIYRIRPVDDFNEIVYHRLDTVRVFLAQTRPRGATRGLPVAGMSMQHSMGNSMNTNGNMSSMGLVDVDGLMLNPLQKKIYEYVKSKQDGPNRNGVSIDDIARDVTGNASKNTVREIMEGFASDGHVYTTIDDNHYSFCRV